MSCNRVENDENLGKKKCLSSHAVIHIILSVILYNGILLRKYITVNQACNVRTTYGAFANNFCREKAISTAYFPLCVCVRACVMVPRSLGVYMSVRT